MVSLYYNKKFQDTYHINGITEVEKIYKILCGRMHTLLLTSQRIFIHGLYWWRNIIREGIDNMSTKVNINIFLLKEFKLVIVHSIAYYDKLNKIFFWGILLGIVKMELMNIFSTYGN